MERRVHTVFRNSSTYDKINVLFTVSLARCDKINITIKKESKWL